MPQHGYESVLSIILTCVAAETSSRFGSFYRGSYSPQPRGQRRSCCRSAWHTFCTYKAQWGRHTQTDQGKSLCLMWTFYAEIIYLFIFNVYIVCVCVGNGSRGEWSFGSKWSQPCPECSFQTSHHTARPGYTTRRQLAQRWGEKVEMLERFLNRINFMVILDNYLI